MSYEDDFYTDEPIGAQQQGSPQEGSPQEASPQPPPKGGGGAESNVGEALWDYVPPQQSNNDFNGSEEATGGLATPPPLGGGWGEASSPSDISLLLSMIRKDYWSITNNKSFYEQALFMAGYEDDTPIVPFNVYFPCYRLMTVEQLRSYFTIRKLFRLGQHPDVPMSYRFVYAYETLMQIGVATPEEGYEILCDLRDNYPDMNTKKHPYIDDWLRDYVVWYGLSEHYAECFAEECRSDHATVVLNEYNKSTDEELFAVLDAYARNVITKGVLYKKQPKAAVSAVAGIVRRVAPIIEKQYGGRLGTLCFGKSTMRQHIMFGNALFYAPEPVMEAEADVAPMHKYVCHHGLWRVTGERTVPAVTSTMLRNLLHDIDALVRQKLGVKPFVKTMALRPGGKLSMALPEALNSWYEQQWKKELRQLKEEEVQRKEKERLAEIKRARESVSIDLSKLSAIREDAEVVREKLIAPPVATEGRATLPLPGEGSITETSKPKAVSLNSQSKPMAETINSQSKLKDVLTSAQSKPKSNVSEVSELPKESAQNNENSGSSEDSEAATFIRLIMEGGDYRAYLRSIHTPAGVMVEKINDKAMEVIGDIVLEDDGENITIIDDYRDDIVNVVATPPSASDN